MVKIGHPYNRYYDDIALMTNASGVGQHSFPKRKRKGLNYSWSTFSTLDVTCYLKMHMFGFLRRNPRSASSGQCFNEH